MAVREVGDLSTLHVEKYSWTPKMLLARSTCLRGMNM